MKKLKVSLAALAFVFALALSAFTVPQKPVHKTVGDDWFEIINPAAPDQAASYNYVGSSAPCTGNDDMCAIRGTRKAAPNDTEPLQDDVDFAKSQSSNFSTEVDDLVEFKLH